jgi:DNA-binding MarR family transcriptional regulator
VLHVSEEVSMRGFGDLEALLMDRLWSRDEPTTIRELVDELRQEREIAYTTVQTVMDNLHRKGWLSREPKGRAYARGHTDRGRGAAAAAHEAAQPGSPSSGGIRRRRLSAPCRTAHRRQPPVGGGGGPPPALLPAARSLTGIDPRTVRVDMEHGVSPDAASTR